MKVEVIKHFINDGIEYGYYLVDGKLVVQYDTEYKAIPFFYKASISKCLSDITQKAIDAIKEEVG